MGVFPWEVDSVVITLAIWTDNRNCVQKRTWWWYKYNTQHLNHDGTCSFSCCIRRTADSSSVASMKKREIREPTWRLNRINKLERVVTKFNSTRWQLRDVYIHQSTHNYSQGLPIRYQRDCFPFLAAMIGKEGLFVHPLIQSYSSLLALFSLWHLVGPLFDLKGDSILEQRIQGKWIEVEANLSKQHTAIVTSKYNRLG